MEAAHRVMQTVGPRQAFRIKSFTTALKVEETPLQAADMLAWHWLKRARNLRKGNRKLRGDFKSLLEVPTDVHHYDQSAAEFLAAIRQMDLLA